MIREAWDHSQILRWLANDIEVGISDHDDAVERLEEIKKAILEDKRQLEHATTATHMANREIAREFQT